jgi:hypothetical protein
MFNRKITIASALLAPALAISTPASAVTSFTGAGYYNFTNGSGAFADAAIPAGTFTDTIEFTVATAGVADVGVLYLEFVNGIQSLSATFNGAPITFTEVSTDVFLGEIKASILPGTQTIAISGISNGLGASYSGNVKFAAVPELGTWLMMIAGIGFAGFALRRHRPAYKVNFAF